MRNIHLGLLFIYGCVLFTVSCKAPDGAMGPSGTDTKGSLVGFAKLHDRLGVEEISDSIKVKADGSSPLIYAYTDSTGMFELKNLPTGTYDLVYEKKGYGYNKLMGVEFVGGSKKSYVLDAQPVHLIRYPLPNEVNIYKATLIKAFSIKKSISGSYETITPSKIDYLQIYFNGGSDTSEAEYGSGLAIYTYKNDSVSRNKFDFCKLRLFI